MDTLYVVIEGEKANTDSQECQRQALKIGCKYDKTLVQSVTLTTGDPPVTLLLEEESSWETLFYNAMSHTVRADDAIGTHTYTCTGGTIAADAVTIRFVGT